MQHLTQIFNMSEPLFIATTFFVSLLIGSFLNVIIARLPSTLNKEWSKQCYDFLKNQMQKSLLYMDSTAYELKQT